MDYKYEFERLLCMADQAVKAIDFDNRKALTFTELQGLKNAVDYYNGLSIKLLKMAAPAQKQEIFTAMVWLLSVKNAKSQSLTGAPLNTKH